MDSIKTDYDFIIHSCNRTISMLNQYINHISSPKQLSKDVMKETIFDILSECQYIARLSLYSAELNFKQKFLI